MEDKIEPQQTDPPRNRAEDNNPLLKPARRVYVGILFILMCIAIGAGYFALQDKFNTATRNGCQRANAVRIESNNRIGSGKADEKALLDFLKVSSKTRGIEAKAWSSLGKLIKKGPPSQDRTATLVIVNNLVNVYHHAQAIDNQIKATEQKVHFDNLVVVNCSKLTSQ